MYLPCLSHVGYCKRHGFRACYPHARQQAGVVCRPSSRYQHARCRRYVGQWFANLAASAATSSLKLQLENHLIFGGSKSVKIFFGAANSDRYNACNIGSFRPQLNQIEYP